MFNEVNTDDRRPIPFNVQHSPTACFRQYGASRGDRVKGVVVDAKGMTSTRRAFLTAALLASALAPGTPTARATGADPYAVLRHRWLDMRVEELTEEGRMRPSGIAEVEAAKADGRWGAAYESQKGAAVPEELVAALQDDHRARAAFEALGRTDRYLTMLGVLRARTPESQAVQVAAAVVKLRVRERPPFDTGE